MKWVQTYWQRNIGYTVTAEWKHCMAHHNSTTSPGGVYTSFWIIPKRLWQVKKQWSYLNHWVRRNWGVKCCSAAPARPGNKIGQLHCNRIFVLRVSSISGKVLMRATWCNRDEGIVATFCRDMCWGTLWCSTFKVVTSRSLSSFSLLSLQAYLSYFHVLNFASQLFLLLFSCLFSFVTQCALWCHAPRLQLSTPAIASFLSSLTRIAGA